MKRKYLFSVFIFIAGWLAFGMNALAWVSVDSDPTPGGDVIVSNVTDSIGVGPATSVNLGSATNGTLIRLSAGPDEQYSFVGWYEGITLISSAETYSFASIGANRTFSGKFQLMTNTVIVTVKTGSGYAGAVSGTVAASNRNGRIASASSVTVASFAGDTITVEALTNSTIFFFKWLGDVAGDKLSDNPLIFTGGGSKNMSALFSNGDLDGDNLDDWWERANSLDPESSEESDGAGGDKDGDTLNNVGEFEGPVNGNPSGINSTNRFSSTDPNARSSDGDGMNDAWEAEYGLDPNSATNRNGKEDDIDQDGLDNFDEYLGSDGEDPTGIGAATDSTDPQNYDSDSDLLGDGWEVVWKLDPNDWKNPNGTSHNQDNDYLPGVANNTYTGNPPDRDNGYKPDPNNPFHNYFEFVGFDLLTNTVDDPGTDPTLADSDNDGMPDGWEYFFWGNAVNNTGMVGRAFDPASVTNSLVISRSAIIAMFNPTTNVIGAASQDIDSDGLKNVDEMTAGTSPIDWDTDGDRMPDGWEVAYNLDPLNPDDGGENPDNDWMADDGTYIHYDVYANGEEGFDPRTGWAQNYMDKAREKVAQPNTREFTSLDEFWVALYYMRRGVTNVITSTNWNKLTTDPISVDTDSDGMPDGWELYVGLRPVGTLSEVDAGLDIDAPKPDGLTNLEEFRCVEAAEFYPADFPVLDAAWQNKVWPTDPNIADTDRDTASDFAEAGVFKYGGGSAVWSGACYPGGGLNPTCADTDGDWLPDGWEATYAGSGGTNSTGMDGTVGDSSADYDKDGLVNYKEYWVNAVYHWQYDKWTPNLGVHGYDPSDFFMPADDGGYGEAPYQWDWSYWFDPTLQLRWYFILAVERPGGTAYASTSPMEPDSDGDLMDDYYEIYHGLNPIFGTYDLVMGPGILASPGEVDGKDIRVVPHLNGSEAYDSDQDGLPNIDESLQVDANARYYHTDPSPMWINDTSYELSWPNLYYQPDPLDSMAFFWDPFFSGYVFSFEMNEGFDTDNDNLPDRGEIIDSSVPGGTDPLDAEDPINRCALYLNGNAAARTMGQYYHGSLSFEQFTLEAWVRPKNPASGSEQVILERPLELPNGNPMGYASNIRLNFRLALNPSGYPYVQYTGSGFDLFFVSARAGGSPLPADEWSHLAATFDGTNSLSLYVNGALVQSTPATERPANGWFGGKSSGWIYPAPLVIGARDNNPGGDVAGSELFAVNGQAPVGASFQPELDNFFYGWVDEVRIWNSVRTEAQIATNMFKRFTTSDIEEESSLLYHFPFDDLPDPDHSPVSPAGYSLLNGRPNDGSYSGVPWWRTAADRSMVYDDYFYIPWIQNTVAHQPADPPFDSPSTPVVETNETGAAAATNVFPNASNPYNFAYRSGSLMALNVFNDLLPLRFAEADEDVEMWDGGGPGTAAYDTDEDGLPDDWETANGLNPHSSSGMGGAVGDPDNDGLSNLDEYRAGTDPTAGDSDGDGTPDEDEDGDGDGLVNWDEVHIFGTNPGDPDTDDDGFMEGDEVNWGVISYDRRITSPVYSRSPLIQRSLVLDGIAVTIDDPIERGQSMRFDLPSWTIECWVMPTNGTDTGSLIKRVTSIGQTNFALRLNANVPVVEFTTVRGGRYFAGANAAISTNAWTHLAGVWDEANDSLKLYVNGVAYQAQASVEKCAQGLGTMTIGGGIEGLLDNARIWRAARTDTEIAAGMNRFDATTGGAGAGASANVASATYGSVVLPQGDASFADQVMAYYDGGAGGTSNMFNDPQLAIGSPDTNAVSLGRNGWIIVSFTDNRLTGNGNNGDDLYIFQGMAVAGAGVEISENGVDWISVGSIRGTVGGIDIDPFMTSSNQTFTYVRITDNGGNSYFSTSPGADIDAVAAISSVSPDEGEVVVGAQALVAWYPFDDGGTNAEDFVHLLDADYAIAGVAFATNAYADVEGVTDNNGNGIADWWEEFYYGGYSPAGDDGDKDGINNLYEYFCDTNPKDSDTDNDGITDGSEDFDGDELENADENLHGSDPRLSDTDDDGLFDSDEIRGGSDPRLAMSPLVQRVVRFGGGSNDYMETRPEMRFGLTNWTIEAWVNPSNGWTGGGYVFYREIEQGIKSYFLGIDTNLQPVAGIGSAVLTNAWPIKNDGSTWTHLAVTFESTNRTLRFFVDGVAASKLAAKEQIRIGGVGPVLQRIGQGFAGMIDEVRIWSVPLSQATIDINREYPLVGTESNLTAYYRFDDGTYYDSGAGKGVSGMSSWTRGQAQDFVISYAGDWSNGWRHAGTLRGAAAFSNLTAAGSPLQEDSDGDGMPDAWELANGLDYLDAGDGGNDLDQDGTDNLNEYRAGQDPNDTDSDGNGVTDGREDTDGDGLTNTEEARTYRTNPGDADTDDDGISDGAEINGSMPNAGRAVTSPLYSLSPLVPRSMALTGNVVRVPEPRRWDEESGLRVQRFAALNKWVAGAWILTKEPQTGSVLRRETITGRVNFDLGLSNNVPYTRFMTYSGVEYRLAAGAAIPTNEWVSLMGLWQPENDTLSLYVNDAPVTSRVITADCANGPGNTMIGGGITGNVDDIYIAEALWGEEKVPDYVMVLDMSGSMGWGSPIPMTGLKNAALEAIDAMPNGAEMAIITFDHEANLASDFTTDREALKRVVNAIQPRGGTDYTVALQLLLDTFKKRQTQRPRIGIFISDGEPNSPPPDSLIQQIADEEIVVHAIGFGSGVAGARAAELQRISDGTGGKYYPAPTAQELRQIAAGLVTKVSIAAFYPFDDGGTRYAEDIVHRLNWDYALDRAEVTLDSTNYNTGKSAFNTMFDDDQTTIPEWWGSFLFDKTSVSPNEDPDGDGLNNLYEYVVGTHPTIKDSDGDLVPDGNEDADGDGLSNIDEQTEGTNPLGHDSDDDGLSDLQELDQGLNPLDSISPYVMRYIHNDGKGLIRAPRRVAGADSNGSRFNLSAWTIDATVRLDQAPTNEVILVGRYCEPNGQATFELGIATNSLAFVRFHSSAGVEYKVKGRTTITTNTWITLTGRLGKGSETSRNRLSLFQDFEEIARDATDVTPMLGAQKGDLIVAANLVGDIDEVRVWKEARSDSEITGLRGRTLLFGADVVGMGALSPNTNGLEQIDADYLAPEQWTIQSWFKTEGGGTIVQRGSGWGGTNYRLFIKNGMVAASLDFEAWVEYVVGTNPTINTTVAWGTYEIVGASARVDDGEWHHAAYTFDGQTMSIYVDGIFAGSGAVPPANVDSVTWRLYTTDARVVDYAGTAMVTMLGLGSGNLEVGLGFAGLIDELAIFDTAYDSGTIARQMSSKSSGPQLIGYYDFDGVDTSQGPYVYERIRNAQGILLGSAEVLSRGGDNAPIDISPLDSLRPKLAAYWPMDDGRSTNAARSIEDFVYRQEFDYAGTLSPSTNNIDFYPSANVLTNTAAMSYPRFYSMILNMGQSPWRMDSDNDGMPDIFEQYFVFSPSIAADAAQDADGDGLNNLNEYYAETDPTFRDSDFDGVSDDKEDADGDGLSNGDEEDVYKTDVRSKDSDDDGYEDGAELLYDYDPVSSISPFMGQALLFSGGISNTVVIDDGSRHDNGNRFNLSEWTIELSVNPVEIPTTNDVVLLKRVIEDSTNVNFEIGLRAGGLPYARFDAAVENNSIEARGGRSIRTNTWTHLAGRFSQGTLALFVNGELVRAKNVAAECRRGYGNLILGQDGFKGMIKEIRIWKLGRSDAEIASFKNRHLLFGAASGDAGYLRVDLGGLLKINSTTLNQDGTYIDNLMEEWTVEAWVRTTYAPPADGYDESHAVIIARREGDVAGRQYNYNIQLTPGGTIRCVSGTDMMWVISGGQIAGVITAGGIQGEIIINDGKWHHVAYVRKMDEGGTFSESLYVDGFLDVRTASGPVFTSPGPVVLGQKFIGDIDEARIWNRALGQSELRDLSRQNLAGSEYGLISYVNFDLQKGQTADERSTLRNPDEEYGLYINTAGRMDGQVTREDDPDFRFIIDPLRTFQRVALVGYFPADDGGKYVEDFMHRMGQAPIFDGYLYAGAVTNGVSFANMPDDTSFVQDSDADGLLDWWEAQYGLRADSVTGENGAWGDPDMDGLNNYDEFIADTDPRNPDSDSDGINDGHEDWDKDGLNNVTEQRHRSDQRLKDTDDDGIDDQTEALAGSSPALSVSPLFDRVLLTDGTAASYVALPTATRFDLGGWTIEAWIKPTAWPTNGAVIACELSPGRYSYYLGVNSNGQVQTRFTPYDDSADVTLTFTNSLALNEWRHVMASFDEGVGKLWLEIDGVPVAGTYTTKQPKRSSTGVANVKVGSGFAGYIDEARIWSKYPGRRADKDLVAILTGTESNLISYLRFDDGTSYTKGVSGTSMTNWTSGQVEDFTFTDDWKKDWANAGSLAGSAVMTNSPAGSPVNPTVGDYDDDGMPNGWEVAHGLNPNDSSGDNGAQGDPDGDGLPNYYEYLAGTRPRLVDTYGDGTMDNRRDSDGDGLSNADEERNLTHPGMADTDDDGLMDKWEIDKALDPLNSTDPYVMRYVRNVAGNGVITVNGIVPGKDDSGERFNLSEWTVEATARLKELPSVTSNEVILIQRKGGMKGYVTFELGIGTDDLPYTRFQTDRGTEYKLKGPSSSMMVTNKWVMLGARLGYDKNDGQRKLDLIIQNTHVSRDVAGARPALGKQYEPLVLARNLVGDIDEARVWNSARSYSEMERLKNRPLLFGEDVATLGVLSLDGSGWMTMGDREDARLGKWTIEAWFKTTSDGVLIEREAGRADDGEPIYNYRVEVNKNGTIQANMAFKSYVDVTRWDDDWGWAWENGQYRWGSVVMEGDLIVTDGDWHFAAFTFDGRDATLYVDGLAQDTVTINPEQDLPSIGDVDWHMAPTDYHPTPRSYVTSNDFPTATDSNWWWYYPQYSPKPHSMGVQAGILSVGKGFKGGLDEIRIFDKGMSKTMIESHRLEKLSPTMDSFISYFDFDTEEAIGGSIYMQDKAAPDVMATLVQDAQVVSGFNINAPINYSAIDVLSVKLAGYWPMDDGYYPGQLASGQIEDYTHKLDFDYGATFSDTNEIYFAFTDSKYATNYVANAWEWAADSPWQIDSDGDGIADWYEQWYNLDPNRSDVPERPELSAMFDIDGDGLANIQEYYAGTDPHRYDTDGDGFGDYDSRLGPSQRTWGERFDDGDGIPDAWEVRYLRNSSDKDGFGLEPAYYDANLDPDEDGWSNYAEYMGRNTASNRLERSSNPIDRSSFPQPLVNIRLRYHGVLADSINSLGSNVTTRLDFYSSPRMDGIPIATLKMVGSDISTRVFDSGHVIEGTNYIFAYLDVDADREWDVNSEPAGIARLAVGWGDPNNVEIGMSDDLPRYPRFGWTRKAAVSNPIFNKYIVKLKKGSTLIFERTIYDLKRNYLHEGDYLYEGRYGLGAGTYNAQVWAPAEVLGHVYTNFYEIKIRIVDPVTAITPTFVTPHDFTFAYARNQVTWTMQEQATAYTIEIATNSAFSSPIVSYTDAAPYRDRNAQYTAVLPFYAGDTYAAGKSWVNGRYWMRIRSWVSPDSGAQSSFSAAQAFYLDLGLPQNGGKSVISGDIYYFGKVQRGGASTGETNLRIVVESFLAEGLSGDPDAKILVTSTFNTNNNGYKSDYRLPGLHNGYHYLRAFIDLNGNRRLDFFEPLGFAKDVVSGTDYEPKRIDLNGSGAVEIKSVRLVIRDRDTDDDQLPDGWEWMYWENFAQGAYDDYDSDGTNNLAEYADGPADSDPTDPDTDDDGLLDGYELWRGLSTHLWDSDGDGLSDKFEVDNGLDPLNGLADADNDGIPDALEVLRLLTNPRDARELLRLERETTAGTPEQRDGSFVLQWQGRNGVTYQVQYSENLMSWRDAPNGTFRDSGTHRYYDAGASSNKTRYYRVVVRYK